MVFKMHFQDRLSGTALMLAFEAKGVCVRVRVCVFVCMCVKIVKNISKES